LEFLASGAGGGGDYPIAVLEPELRGTVFLTGYHGDAVWDRQHAASSSMVRKDDSGCSISEFRLRVGFFHLPVPFIGATRSESIWRISNSPEMASYSVGGYYDRPICRRLLEEAGVPRGAFGSQKKAAAIGFVWSLKLLNRASRGDFLAFVAAKRMTTRLLRDRVSFELAPRASTLLGKLDGVFGNRLHVSQRRGFRALGRWSERAHRGTTEYGNLLFLWALSRQTTKYRRQLDTHD
jgi:hypothetical protein